MVNSEIQNDFFPTKSPQMTATKCRTGGVADSIVYFYGLHIVERILYRVQHTSAATFFVSSSSERHTTTNTFT